MWTILPINDLFVEFQIIVNIILLQTLVAFTSIKLVGLLQLSGFIFPIFFSLLFVQLLRISGIIVLTWCLKLALFLAIAWAHMG